MFIKNKKEEIIVLIVSRFFIFYFLFFFAVITASLFGSQFDKLIPLPNEVNVEKGNFFINSKTKLIVFSLTKKDINFILKEVRKKTTLPLQIKAINTKWGTSNKRLYPGNITIRPYLPTKEHVKGSYELIVGEEITISAGDKEGILNALATLRQLVYFGFDKKAKTVKIPRGKIVDSPNFSWRGMHLDVSRHFFTVEEVKKYLDYLSFYKYNVFHWHLIDDGGWRLEIKKYPKLAELGGFRFGERDGYYTSKLKFPQTKSELENNKTYGGYYTQEQVKEVIAYAKERGIEVIPEIELPGHNLPALDIHPELRCIGKNINRMRVWGFSRQNSFCAGNEKVFELLESVLDEVALLFPSKYIHIGADEVLRDFWNQCPRCHKRMLEEKIISKEEYEEYGKKAEVIMPITGRHSLVENDKNLHKLQQYFVKRIIKYIHSKGKKVIAWDDGVTHWDNIEDSPLQKGDIIFYWIGNRNLQKAIENGIKVARMHTGSVYFDHNQNTSPSYNYQIVPKSLENNPYVTNILGSQGCVWTEWMNDFDRVEYMVFPRIAGLSENLWTKKKDYNSFLKRVNNHYPIWVSKNIDFRLPSPNLDYNLIVFNDPKTIDFTIENPFIEIDEIDLQYGKGNNTKKINKANFSLGDILSLNTLNNKKSVEFSYVNTKGEKGDKAILSIVPSKSIALDNMSSLKKGVKVYSKQGSFRKMPNFRSLNNLSSSVMDKIEVPSQFRGKDNFISFYRFYMEIEEEGEYTFSLGSDDGSVLRLGNNLVIDNDGPHSFKYATAKSRLVKGFYPVEIGFFELGGSERLDFFVTKDNNKINLKFYQRD